MKAGDLNKQIRFQQKGRSYWVTRVEAFAQMERLTGNDAVRQGRVAELETVQFSLRETQELAEVDSSWRLLYLTTAFNIRKIERTGIGRVMKIYCDGGR